MRSLLSWFEGAQRPLPWRRSKDPYRIWVAEVLLQQTRVAQAAPYYLRFLQRFPDVRSLARAREETVLRLWQGAGYYSRARRLHAAARAIVRERGGHLPASIDELEELPGFGPYTARAVGSIAFGLPVVALEANGRRVAARWWAGPRAPPGVRRRGRETHRLEDRLAALLPIDRPGEFNEAVMELGETICRPRRPLCPVCPVRRHCQAYATLPDPGAIPTPSPRRHRPHVRASVAVIEHAGRFLIQRRAPGGLLGGLYEFPGGKIEPGERPSEAARRETREEVGLHLGSLQPCGIVHHAYSHFTVDLHVFKARLTRKPPRRPRSSQRWASRADLRRLPLPRATEKVLELIDEGSSNR